MARYHPIPLAIMACALLPLALIGRTTDRDAITDQIVAVAGSSGLSRVSHDLYRDWLNQGAHQYVGFDFDARVRYFLVGACDVDCASLYFEVLHADGAVIGRSTEQTGRIVLAFQPERAGKYQLRATMRSCSIQPCEWGVRVYRR
jgi:hypothetical protein